MKTRVQLLNTNLILFALLFGLVTLNKEFFRPLVKDSSFASILTGSFPNFIAAYLISLAIINAIINRIQQKPKFFAYLSSFLVFVILAVEEIRPMLGASTQYDFNDIIATGIGSVSAIITYNLILRKRKQKVI